MTKKKGTRRDVGFPFIIASTMRMNVPINDLCAILHNDWDLILNGQLPMPKKE